MCGICGIIDYRNDYVKEELLYKMCRALQHRGPDDEGVFVNKSFPSLGLGHRRLSIIDLSEAGHQPMSNEDDSIWIVFNGEIYNYPELRLELEKKGHKFKSNTDTETIIHLYEEYGEDSVSYLRGMFAFAIWDSKKQILYAARDRAGKKPFLYYFKNDKFCFASEFCALLESGLIEKKINKASLHYYLTFGYIPAPFSIYEDVFKLLPAHMLILKDKKLILKKYWSLDYSKKIKISEEDACLEIMKLLRDSVRIRLYSDVPLGVFLSGGIDSSTVVALMSKLSDTKIKTFSIGFDEEHYSELKFAKGIAEKFNTEHHEFIVKPKALEILPLLVERYGEPYADSSCIPTYYVAQQTRRFVTVALNGDGGDELFAGYERYQAMLAAEYYQKAPLLFKKIIGAFGNLLPGSTNPKNNLRRIKRFMRVVHFPLTQRYLRWVSFIDDSLKRNIYTEQFAREVQQELPEKFIVPFLEKCNSLHMLDSLLMVDTHTYLPNDLLVKVDIASMANSLEVRSPFLDHKLMEFAATLPTHYKMRRFIKKYILKKALSGLVPDENLHRRKMGFGVPVGDWFRNELRSLLIETLLSKKSTERGYFNSKVIKAMINQHIDKKMDYSQQLWTLLMLELWYRHFID